MKIFITRNIASGGIELLKKNGFEVSVYKKNNPIPHKEFLKQIEDCNGLIYLSVR